ncbi:hypothetical protein AB0436_10535 [Streptomyces sp. NPDC051322]
MADFGCGGCWSGHTGTVTVLLTRVEMTGPTPTPVMRDFWRYAAGA